MQQADVITQGQISTKAHDNRNKQENWLLDTQIIVNLRHKWVTTC